MKRHLMRWGAGTPERRRESHPLSAFQEEMNHLFDRFWSGAPWDPFEVTEWPARAYAPRVDVTETDNEIRITAELPGMDEKDVELSLAEGTLTLSGEKKEEHERTEKGFHHSERYFGSFRRVIPLPREVVTGKVEAVFRSGVLTVTLPKAEMAKEKVTKVEIKRAA